MDSPFDALIAKLNANKEHWETIATVGDVPLATLVKVARGYTKNPRVETFQGLLRGVESIERQRQAAA